MNPFLLSAGANVLAGLFGRNDEARQNRENTDRANAQARAENDRAWQRNKLATKRGNKWNARQARIAEKRTDENAAVSRRFNAKQADKANYFTKAQTDKAYERSEARDLRNRGWAEEDYAQQKDDFATQFSRSRDAAIAGGFNPLSVLGSQMTPSMGAGGLSSSSYGAGQGAAASAGFSGGMQAAPASVPMAYGAPVAVQPIASNASIVGAVAELGQELSGENAVQRQTDELYRDLAQIQLDQARSGVRPGYPETPVGSVPSLGNHAAPAGNVSSSSPGETMVIDGTTWNVNRQGNALPQLWRVGSDGNFIEYRPVSQSTMYGLVDNALLTGPRAVGMDPSDEVLTVDQAKNVGIQIGAQEAADFLVDDGITSGQYDDDYTPFTGVPNLQLPTISDAPNVTYTSPLAFTGHGRPRQPLLYLADETPRHY